MLLVALDPAFADWAVSAHFHDHAAPMWVPGSGFNCHKLHTGI